MFVYTYAPSLLICEGYAFRSDGRYFVLAERHKSKDTLGVYNAMEGYRLVRVRTNVRQTLCSQGLISV